LPTFLGKDSLDFCLFIGDLYKKVGYNMLDSVEAEQKTD
jgi:hypothetical protein